MAINNQTKIRLLAIRVVESIYEEGNKKPKAGKFLYREKTDFMTTVEQLNIIKTALSKFYNTPLHFIHCDFEIIGIKPKQWVFGNENKPICTSLSKQRPAAKNVTKNDLPRLF